MFRRECGSPIQTATIACAWQEQPLHCVSALALLSFPQNNPDWKKSWNLRATVIERRRLGSMVIRMGDVAGGSSPRGAWHEEPCQVMTKAQR